MDKLIIIVLACLIGFGAGWYVHTPNETVTYKIKIDTVWVPKIISSGFAVRDSIIRDTMYVPISDTIGIDSLRTLTEYLSLPWGTHRKDSMVSIWIRSYPYQKMTWDSIYVAPQKVEVRDSISYISTEYIPIYYWIGSATLIIIAYLLGSR